MQTYILHIHFKLTEGRAHSRRLVRPFVRFCPEYNLKINEGVYY